MAFRVYMRIHTNIQIHKSCIQKHGGIFVPSICGILTIRIPSNFQWCCVKSGTLIFQWELIQHVLKKAMWWCLQSSRRLHLASCHCLARYVIKYCAAKIGTCNVRKVFASLGMMLQCKCGGSALKKISLSKPHPTKHCYMVTGPEKNRSMKMNVGGGKPNIMAFWMVAKLSKQTHICSPTLHIHIQ